MLTQSCWSKVIARNVSFKQDINTKAGELTAIIQTTMTGFQYSNSDLTLLQEVKNSGWDLNKQYIYFTLMSFD